MPPALEGGLVMPPIGPNRQGTVHIDELPLPAHAGEDDDMPEPE